MAAALTSNKCDGESMSNKPLEYDSSAVKQGDQLIVGTDTPEEQGILQATSPPDADTGGASNVSSPAYRELNAWVESLFGKGVPLALISADVDRVSSYVFESAKLTEMRGASSILDLLNVKNSNEQQWGDLEIEGRSIKGIPQVLEEEFNLPLDCVIYAAGGGTLILAPLALAEEIKRRIERLYVETTLTATITVTYQPVNLQELAHGIEAPIDEWYRASAKLAKGEAWKFIKDNLVGRDEWVRYSDVNSLNKEQYDRRKGFGQIYVALGHRLRRAKDSKQTAPIFEVSPFSERCANCHFRPAQELQKADEQPICRACSIKRQAGRKGEAHSRYITDFKKHLDKQAQLGEASSYLKGIKNWNQIKSPADLGAVAKAAVGKARNYVGIIYADGNDLGAKLETLDTPQSFKQFAIKIREEIEGAVFNSLGHLINSPRWDDDKKQYYHPFEIVSIGGDDVYIFVPADKALEMALQICRRFEDSFNKEITLSAGVLIAHVNTPIYFSRGIIKGLLKSAKALSKSSENPSSTIDFQVITTDTAVTDNISAFRERAYHHPRFDEGLSTRPLTLDACKAMIEVMQDLKAANFPLSQLYLLREAVVLGPQPRATNFYYYQQARSKDLKDKYTPLHSFLKKEQDEKILPFWGSRREGYKEEIVTPIVDLVEIYDFIQNPKKVESEVINQ
jgi:CRISPR-associated protein Cmr2